MSIRGASSASPARFAGGSPRGLWDLALSAGFIAAGPALWWFGSTILAAQSPPAGVWGQLWQFRDQHGIDAVETLLGLLSAGVGLLISGGALLAVAALLAQQLARRCGAWQLDQTLSQFSPEFMRRGATVVLGAALALTAVAADSWPRSAAELSRAPLSEISAGAQESVLFDTAAPDSRRDQPASRETASPDSSHTGPCRPRDAAADAERPPSGLFTPEAPAPITDPADPRVERRAAVEEQVVVRLGDSLWDIAADHLGPDATDWEIAASWPRWHAVNRDRIGPDPGVILPGTVLTAPS